MVKFKVVSPEEVQKISSLLKQGISPKEISKETNRSSSTISRVKNGQIRSNAKQRKKRGATKKITKCKKPRIMREI